MTNEQESKQTVIAARLSALQYSLRFLYGNMCGKDLLEFALVDLLHACIHERVIFDNLLRGARGIHAHERREAGLDPQIERVN